MARNRRDVVGARPQWRHADGDDVEAIVKVGAEQALFHEARNVAIACRDETRRHFVLPGRTHAADSPALEHVQKLGLHIGRQLGDLVQEQRAVLRRLDEPTLRLPAVERISRMAEQCRLDAVTWQRGAVHVHERAAGTRPPVPASPTINTEGRGRSPCSIRTSFSSCLRTAHMARLSPISAGISFGRCSRARA